MQGLTQLTIWLNAAANAGGKWFFAPIAILPGWLSATLYAAFTGVLMLIVIKYTSNQGAIKRIRDGINADLLSLKLFKDNTRVTFQAQGRLLSGALKLLIFGLTPTLVMIVPFTLFMGQLSLWYQQRPIPVGQEAVVTVLLNDAGDAPFPQVELRPQSAIEATAGPVRVLSKREICWNLKPLERGHHQLLFHAGDESIAKDLAAGDGLMRVSAQKPDWNWLDTLMYPAEEPFGPHSLVRSIEIAYPKSSSWATGADRWVIFWFLVSMLTAFCFRRTLRVNL